MNQRYTDAAKDVVFQSSQRGPF